MIEPKQKNPNLLERGFSENIHKDIANETYRSMIIANPHCEKFCIEVLARFDKLLERYSPNTTPRFNGNEVEVFIALANIERSIESQGVPS